MKQGKCINTEKEQNIKLLYRSGQQLQAQFLAIGIQQSGASKLQ